MKKSNLWLPLLGIALVALLAGHASAQDQSRTNRSQGQNMRNMDWQNMDPKEIQKMMQQRMMETFRDRLEVTDDAEWKVIEERLDKVTQARMATMADGGGMMGFGGMGGRGGGNGPGGGRGFQNFFGPPSAESEALQKAIDAKSPSREIKEKLAKLQEVRKQKKADLLKAQEDLRKVLSARQEAVATLMSVLD
jgi:hypothetical protein